MWPLPLLSWPPTALCYNITITGYLHPEIICTVTTGTVSATHKSRFSCLWQQCSPRVRNEISKRSEYGIFILSPIMFQTCGFEMLLSQYKKGEIIDYQSDLHWNHFVTSLQDKGYFQVSDHWCSHYLYIAHQGELEGSKLHKELMEKAKQFYTGSVLLDNWWACSVHHVSWRIMVNWSGWPLNQIKFDWLVKLTIYN